MEEGVEVEEKEVADGGDSQDSSVEKKKKATKKKKGAVGKGLKKGLKKKA